jgi:hypothetical protein
MRAKQAYRILPKYPNVNNFSDNLPSVIKVKVEGKVVLVLLTEHHAKEA